MPDYEQGYQDGFQAAKDEDDAALSVVRDAVKQLKHLQQYEGYAKAESDKISKLLREKIDELTLEVEKLRAANK